MLVSEIEARVQHLLNDASFTRWTEPELLRWFNDGQAEIVKLRPDANIVSAILALVPGIQQTIPASGVVLSNVYYNTNADHTVHGSVIRECNRKDLDLYVPTWPADPPATHVIHFMREPDQPDDFWVYPAQPETGTGFVFAAYSAIPATQTSNDDMRLGGEYAATLVDYMAYRAFAKDAEGANVQRAAAHYAAFMQSLGLTEAANAAAGAR